jgi:hypothetical protein
MFHNVAPFCHAHLSIFDFARCESHKLSTIVVRDIMTFLITSLYLSVSHIQLGEKIWSLCIVLGKNADFNDIFFSKTIRLKCMG